MRGAPGRAVPVDPLRVRVVPLQVGGLELLKRDHAERWLQMPVDNGPVRLVGAQRPRRRLDGLLAPLVEPLAERPPVRLHELAPVRVMDELGELRLGVSPRPAHRDPLLLAPTLPRLRVDLIAQVETSGRAGQR